MSLRLSLAYWSERIDIFVLNVSIVLMYLKGLFNACLDLLKSVLKQLEVHKRKLYYQLFIRKKPND